MSVEVKVLQASEVSTLENVAPGVFDDPIDPRAAREFLEDPRHHIAVALDAGRVVGFVSAVHYVHPDKRQPELWINEVSVGPEHRKRGLARAMLERMLEEGRALGCSEAWVLTERDNVAALRLYEGAGGKREPDGAVMYSFALDTVRDC
jgi:aminoglycoside 6'-N-acetyltransferase I